MTHTKENDNCGKLISHDVSKKKAAVTSHNRCIKKKMYRRTQKLEIKSVKLLRLL